MSVLIYLEPLDTLFFRDHRPFIAGDDTIAEGGLPSPLTLYGAIGDYCLKKQDKSIEDFTQKNNDKLGKYDERLSDSQSKFKIKGIFLFKEKNIYFPPFANIYCYGASLQPNLKFFIPNKEPEIKWDIEKNNLDIAPIIITDHDAKPLQSFIEIATVKNYLLNNEIESAYVYLPNEFYQFETRYGNQILFDTKTVENLYLSRHIRFTEKLDDRCYVKSGIAVLLSGLDKNDFTDGDTLSIGGEQKRAKITLGDENVLSSLKDDEIKTKIQETKKFFVYFITPAIFNQGWFSQEFLGKFTGAELVGAVVNKPIYISGWIRETQAKGKPRPLYKAVPQGSVYFFSFENNENFNLDNIYSNYNLNESLSDIYPNAGFGIALIGAWNY
ncbi:MAG: type III-B CRISPR module-associated protein Cmr3 [candidate division WOR-3 bacterium]|nr:type III-B CRISPR module-associated protein Cmr3 [candidate division WOR-3 bacterium]